MPAPDRDSKASPERHPQPIVTAALVLWPQAAGASLDKADIATAPRILHSPDPASERGFAPGTLIIGSAPSLYQVGSDGVPTTVVADLTTHLNGGASKHDATEVDYERADGSKKNIQAGSDTVEAALTDLDDATGLLSSLTTTVKTSVVAAINEVNAQVGQASEQILPMAVFGAWAFDGDGARTNGGGLVGATPTLTEAAPGQCQVENGGVFGNLAAVNAGYSATYQLFPDAPVAETDFVYFGASVKFAEIALDMATVATYDAAGVLQWTFWNGSTWSALTIAHDGTSASTDGGSLAFGRDGAITFAPPPNWQQSTINGGTLYWIRCGIAAGKAANMTVVPITNGKQHEVVTPSGGFLVRQACTITTLRLCDGAATLHTTADVKFVLMNATTGANSGELTFGQDVRNQRYTGLSLACASGDVLGVYCTQEDGAAEPSGVMLELGVTVA